MKDVLSLQGEIAAAIANEVEVALTPFQKGRLERRPVDPDPKTTDLLTILGLAYLRNGDRARAEAILNDLRAASRRPSCRWRSSTRSSGSRTPQSIF